MGSNLGLQVGTPDIRSANVLAFGPDNVLFVADNQNAKIFAVDVGGGPVATDEEPVQIDNFERILSGVLGCNRDDVVVRDMAVHPSTHDIYLSVARGRGREAIPLIMKVDHLDGSLVEVVLNEVPYAEVTLRNAPDATDPRNGGWAFRNGQFCPAGMRTDTVTDMAYTDGTLLVAGLSNEEFASNFRRIPFPFTGGMEDNSVAIWHMSHSRFETEAPIRSFVPFDGHIVATFTCTPLVRVSFEQLASEHHIRGETVAELGPANEPIDMVPFTQEDRSYVLISSTNYPAMKVACDDVDVQPALTQSPTMEDVLEQRVLGVPRQHLDLRGLTHLANLNGRYVLALQRDGNRLHMRSLETASL